ncbi:MULTISPECIES: hypothetical protein [unclassified Polaribacter]|uniref:hypothetical protein n=1 Tax=unclassified Polaribacter TaxID=196858 RepID=UPI0011BFC606|nr:MULTISPECIES: hypothetical protein [unclassified Polaribacter]TXD53030.1 hypothetical protein ES043_05680 [Polaribacter sp. IC063]TXD59469.1 hypothetical protein ES044_10070 [Polaribacter sp. IC066]
MKPATLKQLKDELKDKSALELKELCLQLSRFKIENKELLTYLLFESHDEDAYIQKVKEFIDVQFIEINSNNYYYIRKATRKILTKIKKHIRYSKKKETEVALLLYFCVKLKSMKPSMNRSQRIQSIFETQVRMIKRAIDKLHEDLQYDFNLDLNKLLDNE